MRKRTKKKKRCCAMCKAHKRAKCDKRHIKQVSRDIKDNLELKEIQSIIKREF
jgi:hypothetical protein